jgi:hypothetical protein
VHALWLKRNPLKLPGCYPLADLLRTNTFLRTLDLTNTGILDEGTGVIMGALAGNTTLQHLYLGTNGEGRVAARGLYSDSGQALANLRASIPLCRPPEGGVLLAGALQPKVSVFDWILHSHPMMYPDVTGMTAVGAGAIARHLATGESRLVTLGISVNRLGDEGVAVLAEGLKHDRWDGGSGRRGWRLHSACGVTPPEERIRA